MLDISKKIDKLSLETLKTIKDLADSLKIDFFLVGASVRDMILHYVYDIKIYRATNDIDFAVRVQSREEYEKLITEVEKNGFRKDERIAHRFYSEVFVLDFIPFGEIADVNNNITWQDNENKEMNVIGFDEAYLNSEDLIIQKDPEVIIKVASVESLVMLKIFAWDDRAAEKRLKDAKDIYLIISNYLEVGNEKRLFEDHLDLISDTYDYEITGARLLGRNISNVTSDKVRKSILEILEKDKLILLATEMARYEGLSSERDEKVKKCLELLNSLREGLEDNQ